MFLKLRSFSVKTDHNFAFLNRFAKNMILFLEIAIIFQKKRSQFCISQSFSEKHDPVF